MFVTSLEALFRADDVHNAQTVEYPTWANIVQAMTALDGDTRDGVILNGPSGSYMGIVGGRAGEYVVAGRSLNGKGFILAAGERRGQSVVLNIGGQENEYADYEVVGLQIALDVARTFVEFGRCDDRFQWNERAARMSAN